MELRPFLLLLVLGTATLTQSSTSKWEQHPADESHIKTRFSDIGHMKHPHSYILEPEGEEHYGNHGGKAQSEGYVDSEEVEEHKEKEEAVGNENADNDVRDDAYDDHSDRGSYQELQAGGLSFDKHLKDHKADNKEVDVVKAHNAGEKFGGEAVKEHKVGKHKEKSKGHKLHGFKNVYHKEEYGDHKTFHDEFLDSDHQHNYDDQHEHKEMEGGQFSKGFKREGKNKKFDKGDEKREWGKEEFDAKKDGGHEKGGQLSKHRHQSKKHQGRYDGNVQKNKNSVRKVKKGNPPAHPHHHGPHHAEIQPYAQHFSHPISHHQPDYSYSHYKPEPLPVHHHGDDGGKGYDDLHSHQHDDGHQYSHSVSHSGGDQDEGHREYAPQDEVDHQDAHYEERTPKRTLHRAAVGEPKDDVKVVVQRPEPVAFKQPVMSTPVQYQPRQVPAHQANPVRFGHFDPTRQDGHFRPAFQHGFAGHHRQPEGYRYGFPQARYPFHEQRGHQPFTGFNHHHSHHGHHQPHHHFRHASRQYPQEAYHRPAVQAQTVVHVSKSREDGKPVFSPRHPE